MTTLFAPFTLDDVMALLPGLNERALKEELREHGCATEIRGKLYVTLEQFRRFMELKACPSKSRGAKASPSSPELLQVNAFEEALKLATQKSLKASEPKRKRVSSRPPSMEPRTRQPSLTLISSTAETGTQDGTRSRSSVLLDSVD